MNRSLPSRIAWRYLWSKKSHSAVSAIAAVSIIGVAVATAAIVCVLSVFNGFRNVLTEKLDTLCPEIVVQPSTGKAFADADSMTAAVRRTEGVAVATPTITDNALALYGTHEMPVTLKGVVPADYSKTTAIRYILLEGSRYIDAEDSMPGTLLSIGSAMQLGARELDSGLLLFAPRREGRVNLANPAASFRQDSVLVRGVFQAQQSQFDDNMVIVPIDVARNLFQYDTEASAIEIKVRPGADIEDVAARLRSSLGKTATVKDRLQQQEINFRMIEIEKWVTFLLLFFILTIASFNLVSTLSMLVLEKQDSLHTLRSLGMTRRAIAGVFRWESLLVSLIGGAGGILLGVGLCLLQEKFGMIKLNGDPGSLVVSAYPVEVRMTDLAAVAAPILLIGLLTGWISGRFARSRLKN